MVAMVIIVLLLCDFDSEIKHIILVQVTVDLLRSNS